MTKNIENAKNSNLNEVIGKFIFFNEAKNRNIQGWVPIERSFKQFVKDIKEEIEYELISDPLVFEKYSIYFIDTSSNELIEINDDRTLNSIRRNDKILIVLLEKLKKSRNIEDIPLLHQWYLNTLTNYEA
ncbi:MAG: hypothetical protein ACFE9S_20070 [Candidatus Hermodarchaeota archaeon]